MLELAPPPDLNDQPDEAWNAYTDHGRYEFLIALDEADLRLDSFESFFLQSNVYSKSFSPKQREVVDRLAMKYPHVY